MHDYRVRTAGNEKMAGLRWMQEMLLTVKETEELEFSGLGLFLHGRGGCHVGFLPMEDGELVHFMWENGLIYFVSRIARDVTGLSLILGWTLDMHFWLPFGRDRLFLSLLTASVSPLGFSLLSVGDNSHTRISSENKQNKHLICVCVWNNLTLHTSFKSYMLSLPQSVHLRDLTKGRPLSLTYLLPFSFPSDLTTPTRFQYSIVSSTLILPSYQFHHPGPVHHIPEQPLRSEQAPPVMRQI